MPDTAPDSDRRLSVVANAIGFEMLRHDGREVRLGDHGMGGIDVTEEEALRCLAAAQRVLDHLATLRSP